MKRLAALLLAVVLLLSLTSCDLLLYLIAPGGEETGTTPFVSVITDGPETGHGTVPPTDSDTSPPSSTDAGTNPATEPVTEPVTAPVTEPAPKIDQSGSYYDLENVILYVHTYGKLPGNFVTKAQAEAKGWEGGSVDPYIKGAAMGGDRFGNYEGLLPKASGRKYTECDIDTKGKARGAKRLIFSNDGLFFYTSDHYETFTEYIVENGRVIRK